MDDLERYGDYNEYEDDIPKKKGKVMLVLKILIAVVCVSVIGLFAFRMIMFNYYPDSMKNISISNIVCNSSRAVNVEGFLTDSVITNVINGVSSSLTLVVNGDVNGDAYTSTADYLQMMRHVKGDSTMEGYFFAAGDMTYDNVVNTTDCAIVRKLISGD